MSDSSPASEPATYRIEVLGQLGDRWLPCFSGLAATCDGEITTLTGLVADQAALRGLLCWLWNLNMTLLTVTRIESAPQDTGERTETQ
jgi:hypothetical protein